MALTVLPPGLVTFNTPIAGHPALAKLGLPDIVTILAMISKQPLAPFDDGLPLMATFVPGKYNTPLNVIAADPVHFARLFVLLATLLANSTPAIDPPAAVAAIGADSVTVGDPDTDSVEPLAKVTFSPVTVGDPEIDICPLIT
ncbi:MAG: hypothetical protein H7251_20205 [Acetobacteraceae bacterium]|nr:hypothetical protein [Acetobacteraceae bacterium]